MIRPTDLTFAVSCPPSVNHYWRHVVLPLKRTTARGKRAFRVQALISADGRKYKRTVCREVMAQNARYRLSARVRMFVALYPPDRRRRDVDNYAKALLDSLVEAGVLADDSQVDDLRLVWCAATPGGRAVVTIRPIPAAPEQGVLV